MGTETEIAWCDHTFNPWIGCQRVSPGCEHCYAEARDVRFDAGAHWGPTGSRRVTSAGNWAQPRKWNRDAVKAGKRARVFCASLADVFEDREDLDTHRGRLFALIAETPALDWLLLTKRPENMTRLCPAEWREAWPANVWAGTTVEDQRRADERIPHLLRVPASVRFLSCEPMLGPVNLAEWLERIDHCSDCEAQNPPQADDLCPECKKGTLISTWGAAQAERYRTGERYDPESADGQRDMDEGPGLHWVIVGGESGAGARPFDLAWARSLVAQCKAAGTACFVKQLGAKASDPVNGVAGRDLVVHPDAAALVSFRLTHSHGGDPAEWPAYLRVRQFPCES